MQAGQSISALVREAIVQKALGWLTPLCPCHSFGLFDALPIQAVAACERGFFRVVCHRAVVRPRTARIDFHAYIHLYFQNPFPHRLNDLVRYTRRVFRGDDNTHTSDAAVAAKAVLVYALPLYRGSAAAGILRQRGRAGGSDRDRASGGLAGVACLHRLSPDEARYSFIRSTGGLKV